jgi:hypothetical protein
MTAKKRNGWVFLDGSGKPFWIRHWEGSIWLFYWHASKKWVSLREAPDADVKSFPHNLTEEEQDLYHTEAGTSPYLTVGCFSSPISKTR